jgi:Holliday junction resolvase RusA-like endonuclease
VRDSIAESLADILDKTMRTVVGLRLPPSTNALWRSSRGRVHRSRRYVSWLKEAGWELVLQRPKHFAGGVQISIAAGRPDRRKRDLDNVATKAVLDLLQAHAVILDDSMVTKLTASWDAAIAPGRIAVTVTPAN